MTDVRVKAAERGQSIRYKPMPVRRAVATLAIVMAVMAGLFVAAWVAAGGASGLGHLAMAVGAVAAVAGLICLVVAMSIRQVNREMVEGRDR